MAVTMDSLVSYLSIADIRRWAEGSFVSGLSAADRARIDKRVANFLRTNGVAGLSIAIAQDDRLVYAKGFGYAKKRNPWMLFTLRRGEPVSVWHRFRIASITKPMTSAAIFTLIDEGRVSLSDTVFGTGSILGNDYGYDALPAGQNKTRLGQITVQHLLEHLSGGWSNDGTDPMFAQPQMDHVELIDWTLKNRTLSNAPGTAYAYSNFGYCLLGRIIEMRSMVAYPNYMRTKILPLCGVTTLSLAGDTLAERQRDEVVYYAPAGASVGPYDIPVARMDSHGGLVASAIDVVRFATRVDGLSPDILPSASITTMMTSTLGGYAKGWALGMRNAVSAAGVTTPHTIKSHSGALPGTTSWVVIRNDNLSWAVLANSSVARIDDLFDLMWDIVSTDVRSWPLANFDLFPLYDDPWRALYFADPHFPHVEPPVVPPIPIPPRPGWQ